MKSASFSPVLALAALLLSDPALGAAATPSTTLQCSTSYGSSKVKHVPSSTSYTRTTQTIVITRTKTPTTTVTPPPVTDTESSSTIVYTTTTLSQNTDTITQTTVETDSITVEAPTSTYTEMDTSTSTTTSTVTTTVPTPDGFQPVSSTLPQPSLGTSKLRRDAAAEEERDLGHGTLFARRALAAEPKRRGSLFQSSLYPEAVSCLHVRYLSTTTYATTTGTNTITKSATATTTTTTDISTSTITQTTQPGDASTTITETDTVTNTATTTPSTTITSTAVATTTAYASGPTYYAQCSNENIADSFNNQFINFVYGNGTYNFVHGMFSAYQCCTFCATDPNCAVVAFDPEEQFCAVIDTAQSTCTVGGQLFTVVTQSGTSHIQDVSNGNCGFASIYGPS